MRAGVLAGMLALGWAGLGWAGAAGAAPITTTYDLTATFTSGPNPVVSLMLGVTYDPTTSGVVTINSFSSAVLGGDLPVTAHFSGYGNGGDISFGNYCPGGACGVGSGQSQFFDLLQVGADGTVTGSGQLAYSMPGASTIFDSQTQTVTQAVPTSVPEPSALALLGAPAALLALGAGRRGRRGGQGGGQERGAAA